MIVDEQNKENSSGENLFEKMENSSTDYKPARFHRSANNIVISGVCGGIAEYSKMDPGNVRVIALLSLLLGLWSIVVYLLFAFLTPVDTNPAELSTEEVQKLKKVNSKTVFSGILILAGFYFALRFLGLIPSSNLFILPNIYVFPFILIGLGVLVLRKSSGELHSPNDFPDENFARSESDRMFMGVCGGLAAYLKIDPAILRILFILFTLLTLGLFSLTYILLSILPKKAVPDRNE